MRIVIVGGTGLIGSALLEKLRERGHDVAAASRATGVDVTTGEGLAHVLAGADAVVDTLNIGASDPALVLDFFRHAGRTLLDASGRAGVKHHVVLSALGADRLALSGFFLAKLLQENLVRASGLPYTILRAAPFFEAIHGIASDVGDADDIRLPPVSMRPVASDDVALALADAVSSAPANGALEIEGPEEFQLTDLALAVLTAYEDTRRIVPDAQASFFGAEMGREKLVAERPWRVAATRFDDWLRSCLASD